MRALVLAAVLLPSLLGTGGTVWAGGTNCNLDDVIGYQLLFARQIVGFIQGGKTQRGYEGCELDRVLLFNNNTGVRCKELSLKHLDQPPIAYVFAKSASDLKICVDGEMLAVSHTN